MTSNHNTTDELQHLFFPLNIVYLWSSSVRGHYWLNFDFSCQIRGIFSKLNKSSQYPFSYIILLYIFREYSILFCLVIQSIWNMDYSVHEPLLYMYSFKVFHTWTFQPPLYMKLFICEVYFQELYFMDLVTWTIVFTLCRIVSYVYFSPKVANLGFSLSPPEYFDHILHLNLFGL